MRRAFRIKVAAEKEILVVERQCEGKEYQSRSSASPMARKAIRATSWFSNGFPERLRYRVFGSRKARIHNMAKTNRNGSLIRTRTLRSVYSPRVQRFLRPSKSGGRPLKVKLAHHRVFQQTASRVYRTSEKTPKNDMYDEGVNQDLPFQAQDSHKSAIL